jgi:hypothetical protein
LDKQLTISWSVFNAVSRQLIDGLVASWMHAALMPLSVEVLLDLLEATEDLLLDDANDDELLDEDLLDEDTDEDLLDEDRLDEDTDEDRLDEDTDEDRLDEDTDEDRLDEDTDEDLLDEDTDEDLLDEVTEPVALYTSNSAMPGALVAFTIKLIFVDEREPTLITFSAPIPVPLA